MKKNPENEPRITPEMTAKFNLILKQVLEYVYYDLTDGERAILATQCKTKFTNQIQDCTALLIDDLNEFLARKVFMELMLESRFEEKIVNQALGIDTYRCRPEN